MEMAGRSLKGQLGHADRIGARFVAIVGERETLLKDMQDGKQERLDTDKVVHAALRGLRELA
jgi:histidyl-tRNA synthetase